jgi:hypothetical protein
MLTSRLLMENDHTTFTFMLFIFPHTGIIPGRSGRNGTSLIRLLPKWNEGREQRRQRLIISDPKGVVP